MNFYIQVYYIIFYEIKFLLYEKYGMLQAPQDEAALSATLHHQIIYRIQDHCFDLPRERNFEGNALMVIAADDQETPTIVQVPRQIHREELRSLIPTKWISNYENFNKKEKQIVAT